jgi:biopolymer transport protein ExbB
MCIVNITQITDTVHTLNLGNTVSVDEMNLFSLFVKGGFVLIPIVILSLLSFYLIIQKYLEIRNNVRFDPIMMQTLYNNIKRGDLESAVLNLSPYNSSYARVFKRVLRKIGRPVNEIEGSIESVASIEVTKLGKNLNYLGIISGIAPMLGFVGTISGVIKIFYSISLTDNISIGSISGGLYEKMISSGTGLVVGIIAFTGYHLLHGKINRFVAKLEEETYSFLELITT